VVVHRPMNVLIRYAVAMAGDNALPVKGFFDAVDALVGADHATKDDGQHGRRQQPQDRDDDHDSGPIGIGPPPFICGGPPEGGAAPGGPAPGGPAPAGAAPPGGGIIGGGGAIASAAN